MSKIVSNKRQMSRLVVLMERNIDIANGHRQKVGTEAKWKQFAVELNRLGPPERNWDKWQRVWIDLKCKIKKKYAESKNKMQQFSPMETAVIRILKQKTSLNPSGREVGWKNINVKSKCSDSATEYNSTTYPVKIHALDDCIPANFQKTTNGPQSSIQHEIVNEQIVQECVKDCLQKNPKEFTPENAIQYVTPIPAPNPLDTTVKEKLLNECLAELKAQTSVQKEFYENMNILMACVKNSLRNIERRTRLHLQLTKGRQNEILKIKREKLKLYKEHIKLKRRREQ